MEATQLDRATAARLATAQLTYPAAVVDNYDGTPDGYASFTCTADLGSADFDNTADALMHWQVQIRSGVRVAASSPTVQVGSVAVLRLGCGPLAFRAPCRVVRVVHEPTRRGFAYGTLPGHPESGEESFTLDDRDGRVTFTITAFSRPATRLARAAGPASRALQRTITRRYLRALTVS